MDKGYLHGLAAGLKRAATLVEAEVYISWEKALPNIMCYLRVEAADAAAHADVDGCIANILIPNCPRCPLEPLPLPYEGWTPAEPTRQDSDT